MSLRKVWIFAGKFILIAPVVWLLWWWLIPQYAWVIGQLSGMAITTLGRTTVDALSIVKGESMLLNSDTSLVFTVENRDYPFHVASLVANLPPLVILVAATPGIHWKTALRALLIGVPVISMGHIAFIFSAFLLRSEIPNAPEIPTAIGYVFLTLPFVLWIVLVQLAPKSEDAPRNDGP